MSDFFHETQKATMMAKKRIEDEANEAKKKERQAEEQRKIRFDKFYETLNNAIFKQIFLKIEKEIELATSKCETKTTIFVDDLFTNDIVDDHLRQFDSLFQKSISTFEDVYQFSQEYDSREIEFYSRTDIYMKKWIQMLSRRNPFDSENTPLKGFKYEVFYKSDSLFFQAVSFSWAQAPPASEEE